MFTVTMVPTSLVLPELLELPPNCPMTCKTLQPKQQTCKLMVSLGIYSCKVSPLWRHMGIWHPSYEGGTQKDSASLYSHCCRISSPSHHCRSCPKQQASATHLSGRSRRCSSHHSWTLLDWETLQGTPSRHPTTQRWTQESQMEPAQS